MASPVCPKCGNQQFSKMDQVYLEQNGQCWSCDRKEWEAGRLTTAEFERRECKASNTAEEGGHSDGTTTPAL